MKFLERDLEEIIENADRRTLEERGLYINGKLLRQVRIGNYGVADLIEYHREIVNIYPDGRREVIQPATIAVYELKKDKVGISAFLQAAGYLRGIKSYLEYRGFDYSDFIFKIILIGSELDTKSNFIYLSELLPDYYQYGSFLETYTYSIDINGLSFDYTGAYDLINKGFTKKLNR